MAAAGGQAAAAAGAGDPVAEGGVVTVLVYQVLAGHAVPPSPADIPEPSMVSSVLSDCLELSTNLPEDIIFTET